MGEHDPRREDVEALLETRRELGPAYEDALVDGFAERLERAVAERVDTQLRRQVPAPRVDANAGPRQLALGIVSLIAMIPLTAISQGESGGRMLLIFAVIVLINLTHALQSRPRR